MNFLSPVDAALFVEKIDGKEVRALVAGKPELEKLFAEDKARKEKAETDKMAALERAVPGLQEYEAAARKYANAAAAYDRASERGYPAKEAAAATAADNELQSVMQKFPATALWRKVQGYVSARNDSKSAAGMAADRAIRAGVPIAEAVEKMEADWKVDAERAVWNS